MMTPAQIRLNQSPILTNLLLGMSQGSYVAEKLFPRLPHALSSITLAQIGNERLKRYNLRRAPGAATKRIEIKYEGKIYSVDEYSCEVPIPRQMIRESDALKVLNLGANLDVSQMAMTTADGILAQDYELDVAGVATLPGSYASGHTTALAAGTKWSATTGTPVTDIRAASDVIRKKIGKRPNKLILSADAQAALITNTEVRSYLPNTQMGPANMDQLKTILNVKEIETADAVWQDNDGVGKDVWGNNAILAYVPNIGGAGGGNISLAEPAFGFTNVIEGHPFAEKPYYDEQSKSWIYGATYERRVNVAYNTAGFLFQNPK
jgi:hypothetical protein